MAKSKSTGSGTTATRTTSRARKTAPSPVAARPSEAQIRERAYLRYLERGGTQGDAEADWFAAEAELRARES
jgi:hypothetical protein